MKMREWRIMRLVVALTQLIAGIVAVVSVAPFQHCIAFLFEDSAQGYLLHHEPLLSVPRVP